MILPRHALFLIAMLLGWATASAQNVYKCGSSYSQTPCADGRAVDVRDPRSAAQKADADAATRRTAKAADALEKSRQRDEALSRQARPAPQAAKAASAPAHPQRKTKKKAPEYFTAAAPNAKPPKTGKTDR